jgi:hypothetical protein
VRQLSSYCRLEEKVKRCSRDPGSVVARCMYRGIYIPHEQKASCQKRMKRSFADVLHKDVTVEIQVQ